MPSFTKLVLKSAIGLALVKSSMAVYSFNTSYNDPMNGHFGNPAEELKNMGASQTCLDAYVANIDCDPILFNFSWTPSEALYTKANFDKACQKTCEVSLAGWLVKTWPICASNSEPETVRSMFTGVGNEDVNMLHYYWSYCTQDLKNGTYCLTENTEYLEVNTTYTQAEKDAACADTCFTQNSASLWTIYSAIGETSTINIADVKDVCPNVDTNNYEVLKPLTDVAAESSTSTTSASPSGTSTSPSLSSSSMSSGTVASQTSTSLTTSGISSSTGTPPATTETSNPNAASTLGVPALIVLPLLLIGFL